MFSPVTPCMPNRLNSQPPITAPTIPRAMSRTNPSPVLLTNLLPMNPRKQAEHYPRDDRHGLISSQGWFRLVPLLDHFVGPPQQCRRDRQADRFRGLEVDDQLEPGGLLDGEVCGLCALHDAIHVHGGAPPLVPLAHSV